MENRITAITIQKKNPHRINVHINGTYSFSLNRIVGAGLKIGQTISDQEKTRLLNSDDLERAFQSAAHFISYRYRSENEVKQNLKRKEFSESVINKTIGKLKEAGLVNDEDFAFHWVEDRTTSKPRSKRMLKYELMQKKVDEEIIHRAIELLPEEGALCLQAAKKRIRQFSNLEKDSFSKKMTTYLLGKGFCYSTVRNVVEKIWKELVKDKESKILR